MRGVKNEFQVKPLDYVIIFFPKFILAVVNLVLKTIPYCNFVCKDMQTALVIKNGDKHKWIPHSLDRC